MKKLIPCLFFLVICCGWVSAQTISYTPPQFALATSGTGHPPYTALATASGLGQVSFTPTFFVPMCSSTGAPPFSQCTFSGGGSTITCTITNGIVYWNGSAYVCYAPPASSPYVGTDSNGKIVAAATPSATLETHTASNSAALNFTSCLNGAYTNYSIYINDFVPVTASTSAYLQFSTNGGTSYDASTNYTFGVSFNAIGGSSVAGVGGAGCVGFNLWGNGCTGQLGIDAGYASLTETVTLFHPLGSTYHQVITGQGVVINSGSQGYDVSWGGYYTNATIAPINAFRIIMSSGNISTGTVTCVGVS